MKILHVIVGLGAGGAEGMLVRLIDAHRESMDFEHVIVSLTNLGDLGQPLIDRGVRVRALGIRSLLSLPSALVGLARLVRAERPDVVQTWMYHADLLGGIVARLLGHRRIVWGIRNTHMTRGTSRITFALRRVCAILSSSIPALIVSVAESARLSHIEVGYDASKFVVIPNGFVVPPLGALAASGRSLRSALGWTDSDVVIGIVGRYNYYKDYQNFVRAAGILAREFCNVRFLCVGRGVDSHNIDLRTEIAATGVGDRFALLGFRSDVPECLAALDIFCLSSRSEGFPNVVGEAMAVGVPCVATNVGDVRRLVGETGVIVAKEDPAALCSGMRELVVFSKLQRAELGLAARRRIVEQFSVAAARERFEHVYRGVSPPKPN